MNAPTLWVDADACPLDIKNILFRAARNRGARVILVANAPMGLPPGDIVALELVPSGPDAADDRIVERCAPGDLVVTADVPLAARIVEKGATGLNPRGESYTPDNVKTLLSQRDFMEKMRSAGLVAGGPSEHAAADTRRFADALDRFLAKHTPR